MISNKNKILRLLLLSLILLLSFNIYNRSGKTTIYVRNESGLGEIKIEISIDGKQVFNDNVRDFYLPQSVFSVNTEFGMRTLTMKTEGYEFEESFFSGIDRYISVEFGRTSDYDDKKIGFFTNKSWSSMMFQ